MKILYLTPGCYDKGGISRFSRYQVEALRSLVGDGNVRVLSLLGPNESSFETPFDANFFAGGASRSCKVRFLGVAVAETLRWWPAVIWSAHVNMSGLAKMLGRLTNAASVANVYGLEVWSGMRLDASWGLRAADGLVSDCHFTAAYLDENHLRSLEDVTVIWDCVDTERFSPGRPRREVIARYGLPDPDDGINILTLGRLSTDAAYKGYERLLAVFSELCNTIPNVRLIFAGSGDLVPSLREQASAAGVRGRVFFSGMIDDNELPDVYRCAHAFSLISDRGNGRGEGIPLTPLEAAACAVPVLVGNQDGSREAAVDGVTGFVLDPVDLESHGRAFQKLFSSEADRTRMGNAARKRAETEFAFPVFVRRHQLFLPQIGDWKPIEPDPCGEHPPRV